MQYLAEFYISRTRPNVADVARRARSAAEQLTREGTPIRFLRAIFLPDDESCFALYEAGSLDAVADAGARAELAFDRIRPAAAIPTC
jgi:hypothetical protein